MGVKTCQGTTSEAAEKLGFLSFRRGAEESLLCRETLRSVVFEFLRILRRGDTYQGTTLSRAVKLLKMNNSSLPQASAKRSARNKRFSAAAGNQTDPLPKKG